MKIFTLAGKNGSIDSALHLNAVLRALTSELVSALCLKLVCLVLLYNTENTAVVFCTYPCCDALQPKEVMNWQCINKHYHTGRRF